MEKKKEILVSRVVYVNEKKKGGGGIEHSATHAHCIYIYILYVHNKAETERTFFVLFNPL